MTDDRAAGAWRQRLAREHDVGREHDLEDDDVQERADVDADAIVAELEDVQEGER